MSSTASFRTQPESWRFGERLIETIGEPGWTTCDMAVAWVRRSGTERLLPAIQVYLSGGRQLRVIAGIDIENTSLEGLQDLLSLEQYGNAQIYVYHNEFTPQIFHPKLYHFSRANRHRLFVGSNNLTLSGLYVNSETTLELEADPGEAWVEEVSAAISHWLSDEGFVLRLDQNLLQSLESNGYVLSEQSIRDRRRQSQNSPERQRTSQGRAPLFRTRTIRTPQMSSTLGASVRRTHSVLMRVRKARGTQVQLPKAMLLEPFFHGVTHLISGRDGAIRRVSPTRARRNPDQVNTLKVEMPETISLTDPVVWLRKNENGEIVYDAFDRNTPEGAELMAMLEEGLMTIPAETQLTKPSDPEIATWYRFI